MQIGFTLIKRVQAVTKVLFSVLYFFNNCEEFDIPVIGVHAVTRVAIAHICTQASGEEAVLKKCFFKYFFHTCLK